MKIHKKTNTGILCNSSRKGKDWFITSNSRKVTCKKCRALMLGVHIGEIYQYNTANIALTDSEVELVCA